MPKQSIKKTQRKNDWETIIRKETKQPKYYATNQAFKDWVKKKQ